MLTLASVKPNLPKLEKRINRNVVKSAVKVIDKVYKDRDYTRFYVLETIARVPYFSFVSVLHLYETLGISRRADYLETHFAQTVNEYHHLLIMEDLGGDERFVDRFFAQHTAFAYYWLTCLLYVVSPRMAYNLSEQVEEHAYHTYDEFLKQNMASLSLEKPPAVATNYYEGVNNLYDVFVNVRNDEGDHVKTMQECQLEIDERWTESRIFKADRAPVNINSIFFVIGIRIEGLRSFLYIRRKALHVSRYLPSGIWSFTSSIVSITTFKSGYIDINVE